MSNIESDFDEPILFRTTSADVYEAALTDGSLWLRSDQYYREIEDQARKDRNEGVNSSSTTIPIRIQAPGGPLLNISGDGSIGQQIVPHYILSLHGSSISPAQLRTFGNHTFGIKSISKLSIEVLYHSSQLLRCTGYRYGAVYYQNATLSQSLRPIGAPAIKVDGVPPIYLNPLNTDVLRKQPIMPFIEQDEWRIVIFTDAYLSNAPEEPLRINVDPSHFYPYAYPNK